jgi:hypothetical protein
MAPNVLDLHSKLRAAKKKAVEYFFLLLMTILFFSGIILVIASATWHLGEVPRDIGISMLVAGTVGLGVELFSRREMEKVLGELIEEKLILSTGEQFGTIEAALQNVDRQTRSDAESLRRSQEEVLPKLDELRTLAVRGGDLLDMGVNRLTRRRQEWLLQDFIQKAEPGSTIRVLALCLNTLANNSGRDLFKRKLREGCHIKLLLLDPREEAMLEERARQENRTTEEEIREFIDGLASGTPSTRVLCSNSPPRGIQAVSNWLITIHCQVAFWSTTARSCSSDSTFMAAAVINARTWSSKASRMGSTSSSGSTSSPFGREALRPLTGARRKNP